MKKYFLILTAGILLLLSINSYAQTPYSGSINIGANVLFSDFKKVYKSGASGEASILYDIPGMNWKLSFSAGYNGFKYDASYFNDLVRKNLDEAVVNYYPDWNITDIPVMVGMRYKAPSDDISVYGSIEVGIHVVNFKDRFNGNKLLGNDTLLTLKFTNADACTETKTTVGLGVALGTGFEIPLVDKVNLDIGLKYKYCGIAYFKSFEVLTKNGFSFDVPELKGMSFLTIKAGVIIDF